MRIRREGLSYRSSGGFTLLELLLAFMVFALSFATVLEILSGSMRNTVRARHFTEAALTAQSVMDQVGVSVALEPGVAVQGESGEYRWALSINEFEGDAGEMEVASLAGLTGITLLQVDLFVTWGEPGHERERRFSTVKAVLSNQADNGIMTTLPGIRQ